MSGGEITLLVIFAFFGLAQAMESAISKWRYDQLQKDLGWIEQMLASIVDDDSYDRWNRDRFKAPEDDGGGT